MITALPIFSMPASSGRGLFAARPFPPSVSDLESYDSKEHFRFPEVETEIWCLRAIPGECVCLREWDYDEWVGTRVAILRGRHKGRYEYRWNDPSGWYRIAQNIRVDEDTDAAIKSCLRRLNGQTLEEASRNRVLQALRQRPLQYALRCLTGNLLRPKPHSIPQ